MGELDSKMQSGDQEAEVFETSDVDEEEVVKNEPEPEVSQGEDRVETSSVAPEDAFEKFSGKTYAVLPSGLSDSLARSGLYDPSHLSILGRAGGVETPQQRLMRLKHEVKELSLEMGSCDGADPSESFPSDVLSEVSALTQQLEALQTRGLSVDQMLAQQIQAKLGEKLANTMSSAEASSATTPGVYELFAAPSRSNQVAEQSKVAELEQRLAFLEECIGVEEEKSGRSLADSVCALERQVEILDTGRMDAVSRKAQSLSQHMAVLLKQKKTAAPSSDQEEQIQRMFDTMQRWEGAAKELPGVVARLRSLQSLHVEGASMVETMRSMEKQHSDMTAKLGTEMSQLESVESTLKGNVDTISANMKSLEERIAAVK